MTIEAKCGGLALAARGMATRAALEYIRGHNHKLDDLAPLNEALAARVKEALPGALQDAKEAFECNMDQIAECTFAASMGIAGIKAAQDVMEGGAK